jgi:hypothetical protein
MGGVELGDRCRQLLRLVGGGRALHRRTGGIEVAARLREGRVEPCSRFGEDGRLVRNRIHQPGRLCECVL